MNLLALLLLAVDAYILYIFTRVTVVAITSTYKEYGKVEAILDFILVAALYASFVVGKDSYAIIEFLPIVPLGALAMYGGNALYEKSKKRGNPHD